MRLFYEAGALVVELFPVYQCIHECVLHMVWMNAAGMYAYL